jgi:hypothetical protein
MYIFTSKQNTMRAFLFTISLFLTLATYGQGVIDNYKASWVGNSFGHAPGAKWVQNYINEIKVTADGTVHTKSHWDEGGRKFGVYKDGDVIGNQSVVINGKSVMINGKTWSISGNIINGPGGKKITDVVKPTSVAKDNQDRLMVTEEGPRQQLLFYDVADEPTLVETFGLEGGIGAHLSIDVSVGEKYPAGDYPRGIYHPYKLWGMTGCGMDERGRIFISTSQNGTVLRAFEKNDDNQWMLDWELFGLFFVDAMDVDPNSDGVDVFGVSEHFRMDYTKDGGKEWKLHGYTVDPVKYPDDPRLFEEIKAGHNHGLTSPFIRYLDGVKFMFVKGMYSQLYVFRFEDNGQICYPVKTLPNSFSWWIDNAGNYWQANGSKIEQWTFTGEFDEKGAPVHEKTGIFDTDNDLATIERVMYDDKNDIMYVGGYSRTYPKNGDEWGILGRVVYRFENFSNNKILSPGYPLVLAYDITPASNIASRVFAKDFTFAGDKLFIIWFIRGPHYLESGYAGDRMRGEISVFKASTGEYEGAIIPTSTIGGPEKVGWIDIPNPAVAFERNNGEIILFVEEDGFGKNILYRICESGNCRNTGYILIDSPLLNARYLPGQSVSIKTDHQVSDTIQYVDFYADTIKIGEKINPPYELEWTTDVEGKYHISSRAVTMAGDTVFSSNSPHIYVYTPAVDSIILSPASSHIQITDSVVFTCRLFDQYGYPLEESIIWEVIGAGSITSEGVFFPDETGTATIVASIGSVSDTATVSVYAPEISNLKIHPAEPMIYTKKNLQLHTLASDQYGSPLQVEAEWAVLSGEGHIDGHGIFTAGLSPGISRVVARTEKITDTLDITIILPTGWVNRDIGTVEQAGSATMDTENDIFEVRASGSDIWGDADQFHYVYKPLHGNGQITARIASFNVTDSWAKVGLMIRGSDSPTAAHVSVFVTGANGVACQFRSFNGGGSTHVPAETDKEVTLPYWLKIDRSGQRFTTYLSADGIRWESFHQFRMTMPDTVLIGLAATSHNNNSLLAATYTHVVSQGSDPLRVENLTLDADTLKMEVGNTRPLQANPRFPDIQPSIQSPGSHQIPVWQQSIRPAWYKPKKKVQPISSQHLLMVTTAIHAWSPSANQTPPMFQTTLTATSGCIQILPLREITIHNSKEGSMVSIYNILGHEVIREQTKSDDTTMDISTLHSGVYFIHVTNNQKLHFIGKIIKK